MAGKSSFHRSTLAALRYLVRWNKLTPQKHWVTHYQIRVSSKAEKIYVLKYAVLSLFLSRTHLEEISNYFLYDKFCGGIQTYE
jgi:hypothetical protein